MSNLKITVEEVKAFHDKVQRETSSLATSIQEVENNIEKIVQMDRFQGEAAEAAKAYFQVLHRTLLQAFKGLFEQLEANIGHHLNDFHMEVDASHDTTIHQAYLDETEEGIQQTSQQLESLHTDIQHIIKSVSDISSARAPNSSKMLEDKEASKQVVTKLSDRLERFSVGYRNDHREIDQALREINNLMSKATTQTGKTQIADDFAARLPFIQSYVTEARGSTVFQGLLMSHKEQFGQATLGTISSQAIGNTAGLQQYMHPSYVGYNGSPIAYRYMHLRTVGTIQQANAWWYQTMFYQTSKTNQQLNQMSLFNYQTSQVNHKTDKLASEDPGNAEPVTEEEAIQAYLKNLQNGEIESDPNWSSDMLAYPEPSFENKRAVMGGLGTGSPDGLAGPATETVDFFTEDIATMIDPNASMADRTMASMFTLVKPLKLLDKIGDVAGPGIQKVVRKQGTGKSTSNFPNRAKLEGHFDKHGKEFNGLYKNADEYLEGAKRVINNGIKVKYEYKGEIRTGYVKFMGNNKNGKAKFEFVGTNNNGNITTYHTQSGKKIWKTINGENIPVINPAD